MNSTDKHIIQEHPQFAINGLFIPSFSDKTEHNNESAYYDNGLGVKHAWTFVGVWQL